MVAIRRSEVRLTRSQQKKKECNLVKQSIYNTLSIKQTVPSRKSKSIGSDKKLRPTNSNRNSKSIRKSNPVESKLAKSNNKSRATDSSRKSKKTKSSGKSITTNSKSTKASNLNLPVRFASEIIIKEEIMLEKKPFKRVVLPDEPVEFYFKGNYRGVNIQCICIPDYEKVRPMIYHEFRMSSRVSSCRNMGVIFSIFEAKVSDMNIELEEVSREDFVLLVIKQDYVNGTLKKYIDKGRKEGFQVEPIHAVQMGINLFSMLTDVHRLGTYLVDVSKKNIYVDVNGSLHFCGFRSILGPSGRFSARPWVKSEASYPEKTTDNENYTASTDVFQACVLMLNIMLNKSQRSDRLFRIDHRNKNVYIIEDSMDKRHKLVLNAVRPGLHYNPEKRPAASSILESLEFIRNQSIISE